MMTLAKLASLSRPPDEEVRIRSPRIKFEVTKPGSELGEPDAVAIRLWTPGEHPDRECVACQGDGTTVARY